MLHVPFLSLLNKHSDKTMCLRTVVIKIAFNVNGKELLRWSSWDIPLEHDLIYRRWSSLIISKLLNEDFCIFKLSKTIVDDENVELPLGDWRIRGSFCLEIWSHKNLIESAANHVMTHLPVAAVIHRSPRRSLPIDGALPVNASHVLDEWVWPRSSLLFKYGLHAFALLDLSEPEIIAKIVPITRFVSWDYIMPSTLVNHELMWVVKSCPFE